jgi:hypothetical protein
VPWQRCSLHDLIQPTFSFLAWAFDTWFLNLFPRESPFLFNEGG